jgi:hypothetical protein
MNEASPVVGQNLVEPCDPLEEVCHVLRPYQQGGRVPGGV